MKRMKSSHMATIQKTLARLRPSTEELAAVKRLEKKGRETEVAAALKKLDNKYDHVVLGKLPGFDRKAGKPAARLAADLAVLGPYKPPMAMANQTMAQLADWLADHSVESSGVFPFTFQSLNVWGSITGPPTSDVRCGLIGAGKLYEGEYTLTNLGDTDGKTRVPLDGYLAIVFAGSVQEKGNYALLLPTGDLTFFGSTRVVGHGNSSTCYDSKVSVVVSHFLYVGDECKEATYWDIHHDATRSEDREKQFNKHIWYEPRYVEFYAPGPLDVTLYLILNAHTEANEDGKAWVFVDLFGFPAVNKTDYDTVITKTS